MKQLAIPLLIITLLVQSCGDSKGVLFERVDPLHSGIHFSNDLTYDPDFNIFRYRNYYNGGGVGLIDFNQDGLLDIYLVANMDTNRLYQNLGDFKFKEVTHHAGVSGSHGWSTGVTIADVNADGWPDIYLCNSGSIAQDTRENELFINNGDGTFTEEAFKYGLADAGYSIHSSFFDYDKDGDLDMYLLNNSYKAIGSFDLTINQRHIRDSIGGDKLFRNDNGVFTDISEEAGIYGSEIGFGLGVTVADVNNDGWSDMYISNDFFDRDYLYINDQNGGFNEKLEEQIKSISAASMGADIADLNNDGFLEIFVTDMLPSNNARVKTVTTFDSWERYRHSVNNGYWHQFTRNTLQFNNGDGTFSEIGRYAGLHASDWSWAALMFDFQNDGLKDVFISNGIFQDLTNQDFLTFASKEEVVMRIISGNNVDFETLISYIPSVPISNHAFVNVGGMTFSNKASELGLGEPSFSNGSAYGDLDNDGDLDLVVNNTNMTAGLFENRSRELYPDNNFLRFNLNGAGKNTSAIGTRITAWANDTIFVLEQMPSRGFQSSIDPRPLMGIGKHQLVDRIEVSWPSGKVTSIEKINANQEIQLDESDATASKDIIPRPTTTLYQEEDSIIFPAVKHTENEFVDFNRDRLIFQMLSTEGPCLCTGDINNDGLEDVFIGGAAGSTGNIYGQQEDGSFKRIDAPVLNRTQISEDVDCALFDANGDGNLDLYVASGGSEFNPFVPELNDRLFFGNGDFEFSLVRQTLPANKFESSSVVKPCDFDKDGDLDLFVGIRMKPYFYGEPTNGYLLENDGQGTFTDVSPTLAPDLEGLGMITDASWTDLDNDGDMDLVIVGEWMPISIFTNENGTFESRSDLFTKSNGWWNSVATADINGDGYVDIIAGNHGLNSRFKATSEKPIEMFVKDFDRNGLTEQILGHYEEDKLYPLALKHDLESQIPYLGRKYQKYEDYKNQQITDIFTPEEMESVIRLTAYNLATSIYLGNENLSYSKMELPMQVQFSNTYAISVEDFNGDSFPDILLAGNMYQSKPEMGRYDASYGSLLIGDGTGSFQLVPVSESGLKLDGEVRAIQSIPSPAGNTIIVANNNDYPRLFRKSSE